MKVVYVTSNDFWESFDLKIWNKGNNWPFHVRKFENSKAISWLNLFTGHARTFSQIGIYFTKNAQDHNTKILAIERCNFPIMLDFFPNCPVFAHLIFWQFHINRFLPLQLLPNQIWPWLANATKSLFSISAISTLLQEITNNYIWILCSSAFAISDSDFVTDGMRYAKATETVLI